ncbi:MAG: phenylacetate-CoA oxygenase subunit PaaJ [Planktomarina sp.]|nr:phenylacetate-CoA oxygenase subunit PaaJ [Planktomarina sp.]
MVSSQATIAWSAAAAVLDPEVPAVTVADLGILRSVEVDKNGRAIARVTPTYSGCPAVLAIELAIEAALRDAGFDPVIKRSLTPAWTTDWITDVGREKLRAYGIAPPVTGSSSKRSLFGDVKVSCPSCASQDTSKLSEFGSTACKAHYRCNACLEPFDYFKCI